MSPPTQPKFNVSAGLQKELQGVTAYVAWEMISTKFESMTTAQQEEKMRLLYHGDEKVDVHCLVKQFLEGEGIFQGLYEKETLEVTNPDTHVGSTQLVLKEFFHYMRGKRISVGPDGISLQLLSAGTLQSRTDITGRILVSRAKTILANCKKMLAYVVADDSIYKRHVQSGTLPSGLTFPDYARFVRQKMYERGQVRVLILGCLYFFTCFAS